MLLREFYKGKYKFVLALTNQEFIYFLNKFYGTLIFRGRKSSALNYIDTILFNLKKKFKKDPILLLHKALNNILPLLSSTQKKMGKGYQAVPSIAVGNRRFVIMLDWIIRKQKNKSNTIGIKIKDISSSLIDAVNKRGNLIRLKKQFYKTALSGKHLLLYRKRNKFNLRRLRKMMYEKKYNIKNKDKEALIQNRNFLYFDNVFPYKKK